MDGLINTALFADFVSKQSTKQNTEQSHNIWDEYYQVLLYSIFIAVMIIIIKSYQMGESVLDA